MAKVKTAQIWKRPKAGGEINFKYDINVNSSGEFYCKVPDELKKVNDLLKMSSFTKNGDRIFGSSLDKLESKISKMVAALSDVKTESCLVIIYKRSTNCCYAINENGSIKPACSEGFKWGGDRMPSSASFEVGFYAQVFKKYTYTNGKSVEIEYKDAYKEDLPKPGMQLNKFYCDEIFSHWQRSKIQDNELPYSDELATNFYNAMIKLCEISESISKALDSPEKILANSKNLLM